MVDKIRIKVAQKAIKMQNMININAYMESKEGTYYDDVIYIEFSRGITAQNGIKTYDTNNSLSFKFNSLGIRELSFGLTELIETKKTKYTRISEPKLSGAEGNKKVLSLGSSEKEGIIKYFINAKQDGNKNIALSFFNYQLQPIADLLKNIADLVDDKQFSIQRYIDKQHRGAK